MMYLPTPTALEWYKGHFWILSQWYEQRMHESIHEPKTMRRLVTIFNIECRRLGDKTELWFELERDS